MIKSQAGYTDSDDHWLNVGQRHIFQFTARSCGAAIIRLKENPAPNAETSAKLIITVNTINITVWNREGNNKTIYEGGHHALFDCQVFRPFWLSWQVEGGSPVYQFGRGSVPFEDVVMTFNDPWGARQITSLHLGTSGIMDSVEWQFPKTAGKGISIMRSFKLP